MIYLIIAKNIKVCLLISWGSVFGGKISLGSGKLEALSTEFLNIFSFI